MSEFIFHREGHPIGDFRKAWVTACVAAGFCRPKTDDQGRVIMDRKGNCVMEPTLLVHDLRRSAARNLRRALGIGPEVGMKITGHETDSMWRRYSIVNEDDIEQALDGVQVYIGEQVAKKSPTRVVPLSEVRG